MRKNDREFLISRYNDPDLSASERKALSVLLGETESRRMEEEYRRLDAMLARIPSVTEGVDYAAFSERVRAGIADRSWRKADERATAFRWIAPLAAAAVFLMTAIPLWYLHRGSDRPGPSIRPGTAVVVNPEIPVGRVVSQVAVMDQTVTEPTAHSRVKAGAAGETAGPDEDGTVMCFVSPEGSGSTGNKPIESDAYLSIL